MWGAERKAGKDAELFPLICDFTFHDLLLAVSCSLEAGDLLLTNHQVSSRLTLGHRAYVIHLPSSYHAAILSSHILPRRRVSTVQDILREAIFRCLLQCITFIITVDNLSLCLVYKINFLIGLYMKKRSIYT